MSISAIKIHASPSANANDNEDYMAKCGVTPEVLEKIRLQAEEDPRLISKALPDPDTIDFKALFGNKRNKVAKTLAIASMFSLFARGPIAKKNEDGTLTLFGYLNVARDENGLFIEDDESSEKLLDNLLCEIRVLHRNGKYLNGIYLLGRQEYLKRRNFIETAIRKIDPRDRGYITGASAIQFERVLNGTGVKSEAIVASALRNMMDEKLRYILYRAFHPYHARMKDYQKLASMRVSISDDGRKRDIVDLWKSYRPAVMKMLAGSSYMTNPKEVHDAIEAYPKNLQEQGYPPSVWRMMLKMSTTQFRMMFQGQAAYYSKNKESVIRLSQLKGETVPATALTKVEDVPADYIHIYAEAARKARRKRTLTDFVNNASHVIDMITRGNRVLPKNMSWDTLSRLSAEWHQWIATQDRSQNCYEWVPLLGEYESKTGKCVELASSADLMIEGRERGHCVGSYDDSCYRGESRIFSLSMTNAKGKTFHSTLELRKDYRTREDKWAINQHQSTGNTEPAADLKKLAQEVCAKANRSGAFKPSQVRRGWEGTRDETFVDILNPLHRYPEKVQVEEPARRRAYAQRNAFNGIYEGEDAHIAF